MHLFVDVKAACSPGGRQPIDQRREPHVTYNCQSEALDLKSLFVLCGQRSSLYTFGWVYCAVSEINTRNDRNS